MISGSLPCWLREILAVIFVDRLCAGYRSRARRSGGSLRASRGGGRCGGELAEKPFAGRRHGRIRLDESRHRRARTLAL